MLKFRVMLQRGLWREEKNNHMFERLFRIMRKTGHRVVMVDPDTEQAYVLLPFSVYEDLLDRAGDEGDELYDDDAEHDFEHVASAWHDHDESTWEQRHGAQGAEVPDGEDEVYGREEAELPAEEAPSKGNDLTPPDLIDTINRDIAAWRAGMAKESRGGEQASVEGAPALDDLTLLPVPGEEASPTQSGGAEEEKFYIEPV